MSRPSLPTFLVGVGGGLIHLAVVEFTFRRLGHVPEALWPLSSIEGALTVFAFGFGVVLVTAHTGLVSPPVGLGALLAWATYRDLTTPTPEWSELGGHLVVDGPVFLTSYVETWYVWLGLLAVVAGVEFGLRRHHTLDDTRLRGLPTLPNDGRNAALASGLVAAAVGSLFGLSIVTWMAGIGVNPTAILPVLFVTTTAAAAVPVGAAVFRGLITPAACFVALVIPSLTRVTFSVSEGGPVFLIALGPMAVGFVIVGVAEHALRRQLGEDRGETAVTSNGE